ncbi:sensor histidine kinase [Leifsonia sp. ZF2019]|uniref:sensor histidine kinase n=1 Tax=Leifsonia sp. ZF2019 TaxID=2781978 RepID=UPI001CC0DE51|nr:sensor histidine kinase [Leifsonia sp. ZF2019]UAJ79397.1 sensor histidine kinase [Leifsonia sp. ZF2019]
MQQQRRDGQFFELRAWIAYSAAATVATVVIILANPYTGFARSVASAAIILILFPLFWLVVRLRRDGDDGPWDVGYCLLAAAGYLVALSMNDWANVALFVLSPQFFLLLSMVPASIAITVVNAGGVLVRWAIGDLPGDSIVDAGAMTLLVIAFSIFFGHRIAAVSKQSAERGRLIDRLRQQQKEIAELSEQQGAASERERIAREMHDTLAQGFTSIVTLGHAVQGELDADPAAARRHVELMTETAQENLQESRRIIAAMTPGRLSGSALPEALERVVARFAEETGVGAGFVVDGDARPAPPAVDVVALRVLQESLSNVRKHAAARTVDVELAYLPDALRLRVTDDGRGFDRHTPRDGYGLDGMAARVREAGGAFSVESSPGAGTGITVELPAPAVVGAASASASTEEPA